ncbi:hypothetical protein LSCM4_00620 [Leishmania orientalis]|uniref:HMG box domain-containing protein n=1 Tax=Leishmania orientalis TaxID=2249476 RepID=A0A836GDC2_9TRYP|nr:hypothetical protein LSCM4_00620 [Leishmania orientalis]
MLHFTRLWCSVGRAKVFEIFCREQLLTNISLRDLTQTARRKAMSQLFKELPEERLRELKQQAFIEQLRQEALERTATFFKPLTTYEFFAREQQNNPAVAGASPREKEVKLLQIFESLPEKAKKAIEVRAERYNIAHSTKPSAPALPVIPVWKKQAAPASESSSQKKAKKKSKKARRGPKKTSSKGTATKDAAEASADEPAAAAKKAVKRCAASPYSVFVREQMASLHHLAPKERMRVIGERWRSLTNEERQRRLEAGKVRLAEEKAAKAHGEETIASMSPPTSKEAPDAASPSPAAPSSSTADDTNSQVASTNAASAPQQPRTAPAGVDHSANPTASPVKPPPSQPLNV